MLIQRTAGVVEVANTHLNTCCLGDVVKLFHIVVAVAVADHQHIDDAVILGGGDSVKLPATHTHRLPGFIEATGRKRIAAILGRIGLNETVQSLHHIIKTIVDVVIADIGGAILKGHICLGINGALAILVIELLRAVLGLHNAGDHRAVLGRTALEAFLCKGGPEVVAIGCKCVGGHIFCACHHAVASDQTLKGIVAGPLAGVVHTVRRRTDGNAGDLHTQTVIGNTVTLCHRNIAVAVGGSGHFESVYGNTHSRALGFGIVVTAGINAQEGIVAADIDHIAVQVHHTALGQNQILGGTKLHIFVFSAGFQSIFIAHIPAHFTFRIHNSRHRQVEDIILHQGAAIVIYAVQVEACVGSCRGDLIDGATVNFLRREQGFCHAQSDIAPEVRAKCHLCVVCIIHKDIRAPGAGCAAADIGCCQIHGAVL